MSAALARWWSGTSGRSLASSVPPLLRLSRHRLRWLRRLPRRVARNAGRSEPRSNSAQGSASLKAYLRSNVHVSSGGTHATSSTHPNMTSQGRRHPAPTHLLSGVNHHIYTSCGIVPDPYSEFSLRAHSSHHSIRFWCWCCYIPLCPLAALFPTCIFLIFSRLLVVHMKTWAKKKRRRTWIWTVYTKQNM